MNRYNLEIAFFLFFLSFVSCNDKTNEDFNGPSLKESLFLNLNIIPSLELNTKADSDGYNDTRIEEGSYLENYIDIKNSDFHIAFFTKDGDFITEFEGGEIINKTENNTLATHSLTIEFKDEKLKALPENYLTEEFKLMIIANWKAYTGNSYESFANMVINKEKPENVWENNDFYDFTYSANAGKSWYPSVSDNSKRLIPMMGFGGFKGFTMSRVTGKLTANASVDMVRSLSKITLTLEDKLWKSGFKIENCTLNKHIPQGKVIPDTTLDGNDFGENGSIQIHKPSSFGNFVSTPLAFVNMAQDGANPVLTAYIPEIDTSGFTTSDANRPYMSVKLTLNDKDFKDKVLEFNDNDLSSTSLFHIVRNHHYNYIIEDIAGDREIIVKYTVCPWGEGNVDIDFH